MWENSLASKQEKNVAKPSWDAFQKLPSKLFSIVLSPFLLALITTPVPAAHFIVFFSISVWY